MPDGSPQIGQDEIERLLAQVKGQGQAAGQPPAGSDQGPALRPDEIESLMGPPAGPHPAGQLREGREPAARPAATPQIALGDMEFLLRQAQEALAAVDAPAAPDPTPAVAPFKLPEFGGAPASAESATLELIRDVELDLKIELGRTQMHLEDVLKLRKGSVVPLDKLAGDPVDIFVNGRLIARGEVLVLNDNFCVRVAELVTAESARVA